MTPGLHIFAALTAARWRSLYNGATRGTRQLRAWAAIAVGGSFIGWLLLFFGCRFAVGSFIEIVPQGMPVLIKLVELLLLILGSAMAYSCVLVSLVHLYLSDDLRFLGVLPATNLTLFAVKTVEIGVMATWAPMLFTSAILAAVGASVDAPAVFYPLFMAGLALFALIPAALAIGATSVAVNLFPANRTRDVLVFLSLAILLALFIIVRGMQPERILEPGMLLHFAASVGEFQLPGGGLLPSAWMTAVLVPLIDGSGSVPSLVDFVVLVAGTVVAVAIGATLFVLLFRRGLSRTLTSRGRMVVGEGVTARSIAVVTAVLPRSIGAVARKDILNFGRDPAQWSQLMLLGALVLVYLLNVAALPLDQLRLLGLEQRDVANLLAFLNLGFVGFVLTAVALRFLFSAVSLEGRAAWVVLVSPIGERALLRAKLAPGLPLLWLFGLVLVGGSNFLLRPDPLISLLTFVAMTLIAVGLSGYGVGLGAMMPRFHAESPTRVAGSVGGLLYMLGGLCFVAVEVALLALPAYVLARRGSPGILMWAAAGLLTLLALLAGGAATLIPLHLGAISLRGGWRERT